LLGRADSALYRAKQDGRDRVCTFAGSRAVEEIPLVPEAA
jgi:predicted signal transduction protein with EAL and GGDEF domain